MKKYEEFFINFIDRFMIVVNKMYIRLRTNFDCVRFN